MKKIAFIGFVIASIILFVFIKGKKMAGKPKFLKNFHIFSHQSRSCR